MAALDYIIIAVLLVSAALSLIRGFTKEVLSITGWIVSGYAAIFLGPSLKPMLASYITIDWAVTGGAMLIVFLISLIIFSIGGHFVAASIKGTGTERARPHFGCRLWPAARLLHRLHGLFRHQLGHSRK